MIRVIGCALDDGVRVVQIEQAPLLLLDVKHHQAMTSKLDVQHIGRFPLRQQAGLDGQLADAFDLLLKRQGSGAQLALVAGNQAAAKGDIGAHRAAIGADEMRIA